MYTAESAQGSAQSAQNSAAQASAEAAAAALAAAQAKADAAAAASAAASASAAAASAATAAGIAQTQATQAMAQGTQAYNKAVQSLQPSAATIVNASNQMTAIASNGITVYSGASSSSGARVVMNSLGLAGYDASNNATFSILASTGAATFSGTVTGSSIIGGSLNIAGNAIINSSGLLTATGATITGTINATSGYFGTSTNGWSVSSTGLVGVGGGTIVGGVISGTQFINGSGTFSVSTAGYLIAQAGQIGGSTFTATSITGGIIQTSLGSDAVVMDGANNALGIKYGGTYAGWLLGIGAGQFMMHYGTTPSVTGYPRVGVSSTTSSLAADGSNSLSVTTSGNNMQGNMTFNGSSTTFVNTTNHNGQMNYTGATTASGSTLVLVGTGSRIGYVSSSRKTKKNIETLTGTYTDKINALQPVSFDWLDQPEDMPYRRNYGFIAEDTYLIPEIESVVNLNSDGEPITISYDRLAPFFAKAIQEIDTRLKTLEG
jgi:hypothetical protein